MENNSSDIYYSENKNFLDQYSLSAKIKGFKDKMAILETEDHQEILWPIKKLPDNIKEGSETKLIIRNSQTEQEEYEKTAKALINEFLKEKK